MTVRRASGSPTTRRTRPPSSCSARAAGWCQMRGIEQWQLPGRRHRALWSRELPTTDVAVRARRRRHVPARGARRRRGRRPAPRHQPRQGRLPLEGRGRASSRPSSTLDRRRRVPTRGADGASRARILPPGRADRRRRTVTSPSTTSSSRAGSLARVCRLDVRDRRHAPRHVHRRRPRRRQPDRLDRLLVLGRRPDPRPAQPQPRSSRRSRPTCRPSGRSWSVRSQVVRCTVVDAYRGARLASTAARTCPLAVGDVVEVRARGSADPARRAARRAAVLGPAPPQGGAAAVVSVRMTIRPRRAPPRADRHATSRSSIACA